MIGALLKSIFGALIASLGRYMLDRWLNRNKPKEALDAALEAKKREAAAMAAPDRPESVVDAELLRRADIVERSKG